MKSFRERYSPLSPSRRRISNPLFHSLEKRPDLSYILTRLRTIICISSLGSITSALARRRLVCAKKVTPGISAASAVILVFFKIYFEKGNIEFYWVRLCNDRFSSLLFCVADFVLYHHVSS